MNFGILINVGSWARKPDAYKIKYIIVNIQLPTSGFLLRKAKITKKLPKI